MKLFLRSMLAALRQRSPVVVDVPPEIRALLLRRYFEMSVRSSRLTALAFAIFMFGLAHGAPLWPRVAAVAVVAAAMQWRVGLAKGLLARPSIHGSRQQLTHDLLVLVTTFAWSGAPYLLVGRIPDVNLVGILYGALIPLTVVCVGYIAALPAAFFSVTVGAVPLVVFMLQQQSLVLAVMGLATVMCVTTLLARAASSHATLLQALLAERENATLVLELQRYRQALESENATLDSSLRAASQAAYRDALTGLFNRRHLVAQADALAERVRDGSEEVTLCLVDIDHFKEVNDRHGHAVGDEVLRAVGALLGARLRDGDCLARIGGEEFMIVLRQCDAARGRRVAESVRHNVAASHVSTAVGEVPVTVSLGLAQWASDESFAAATERADRALYEAKHGGRDRVGIDRVDAQRSLASVPTAPAVPAPPEPSPGAALH